MLVMRKSQMETFEHLAVKRFEQGLHDHLRNFFPRHVAVLGQAWLSRMVRYSVQRAESRCLETERGIYLYVALMFMLGSRFDEDPQFPWALRETETAAPVSPPSQAVSAAVAKAGETVSGQEDAMPQETAGARIERIYGQAMVFLDQAVGPDNALLQQSLNLFRQLQAFDSLPDTPSIGHRLLLSLQMLAPEKYRLLGEKPLRQTIRHGYENAKRHGLGNERDIMHYLALVFLLGSGFDNDPLYPWAATVLKEAEPAQKGAALREAALKYLVKYPPGCTRRAEQSAVALAKAAKPYRRIIEASPAPLPSPVTPVLPNKVDG